MEGGVSNSLTNRQNLSSYTDKAIGKCYWHLLRCPFELFIQKLNKYLYHTNDPQWNTKFRCC